MNCMVTGCCGFIGYHLTKTLLQSGHSVTGMDNLWKGPGSYDVSIKKRRLDDLQNTAGDFHFLRRSILEYEWRSLTPEKMDIFFHLAGLAGVASSYDSPQYYYDFNATGTQKLLEYCRLHNVGKFVLASSSNIYPQMRGPLRESILGVPNNPYGVSKHIAEQWCECYSQDMNVVVLRYFTVYGPWGRPDMSLFRFVQRIVEKKSITVYGDGTQQRDFTYVSDTVDGTIAAGTEIVHRGTINLACGSPVSLQEAIKKIETLSGRKARIEYRPSRPGDRECNWGEISTARDLLGWQPKISFSQGIRLLYEWYMANRGWAHQIHTEAE